MNVRVMMLVMVLFLPLILLGCQESATEQLSPLDRIKEHQILVYDDRVVIDLKQVRWATFSDTNSMDPVIDQGANALEIVPQKPGEIAVGDIVSYTSLFAEGIIIHRVIETGEDERGWYFRAKGDNLLAPDPGKIRFDQIKGIVVGIIY
ncbi:hypothetical protein HYW21_05440 [Candidatus Woesearchaeota archaeon]|nr:hypothetical protein [Candidatus Woesearchaeota archaeon]